MTLQGPDAILEVPEKDDERSSMDERGLAGLRDAAHP